MGNLLGSPVTTKDTTVGVTEEERLAYGVSSMQGWRVHMEDAHIAEGALYAWDRVTKLKLPLRGHALFAVYDGHGGTFAAVYSGANFLRIFSQQPHFVHYARLCQQEDDEAEAEATMATAVPETEAGGTASRLPSNITTGPKTLSSSPASRKNREQHKLDLLEKAFQQAFVETDYEIALAVRGKLHPDANTPYHPTTTTATGDGSVSPPQPPPPPQQSGAAAPATSDQNAGLDDGGDSGTTACVVLITPTAIVCANAGDSRALFARRNPTNTNTTNNNTHPTTEEGNTAIPLSFDHKPDDEAETKRIRAAGGYVSGGRVEGDLAVSRGLGDFRFKQLAVVLHNTQLCPPPIDTNSSSINSSPDPNTTTTTPEDETAKTTNTNYKQYVDAYISNNASTKLKSSVVLFQPGEQKVSPIPDVIVRKRQPQKDEYIVVACDGIWDVLSNQQVVDEVDHIMYAEGEQQLGYIAEEILDSCLRLGSKDNMTAIVIQLPACQASYATAQSVARAANCSQEGVPGRRRKRSAEEDDQDPDEDNDASPEASPEAVATGSSSTTDEGGSEH